MKHRVIKRCLTLLAFAAASLAGPAYANDGESLEDPLGVHRLLILCLLENSDKTSGIYETTDWKGFAERDLYYIELRPDAVYTIKPDLDVKPNRILHRSDKALREVASCENNFEIVLIGNDGTQKRRWAELMSSQELFATIDAMPFRRFEMRQKTDKN